ncbi:MAG: NADH-quinone oxidoreductase subunit B family protein [Candidatus Altiarchaeota archaeon]
MLKNTSRKKAIHVMLVYSGGCNGCDIEVLNALLSPYYDLEQYRIMLTWNPREADILVVTGAVTKRMLESLKKIYEAIPKPKAVAQVGSCPITGCVYANIYGELGPADHVLAPLSDHIPVDASVPGCPPRPEDIIAGVAAVIPKLLD